MIRVESLANTESCNTLALTSVLVCSHADDLETGAYAPYFSLLLLACVFCGRNTTKQHLLLQPGRVRGADGCKLCSEGPTELVMEREGNYLASYLRAVSHFGSQADQGRRKLKLRGERGLTVLQRAVLPGKYIRGKNLRFKISKAEPA